MYLFHDLPVTFPFKRDYLSEFFVYTTFVYSAHRLYPPRADLLEF